MIYKGCIMKIEDDFAIVLSYDMQYTKVIKKDGMNVGNQIIFVKDDIYSENKINYKHISALAAVIFILFMSINIFHINNNKNMIAAAVVSLDINPSIEFELDKKGIVIKVKDINEEANEIIDKELIGKKIEDALFITINNAMKKKYISSQKNSVLISDVILDSTVKDILSIEKDLQIKLDNDKNNTYINIVYLKSNKNNMKDAHKNDMSIGKYEAFKEIEKQNSNASIYEVKNMKVYQIFDESGKIYSDVIEADEENNYIEVENENINIENEDPNFENQPKGLDNSKNVQDNKSTQTIEKPYDKDKDEYEDKDKNKHKKNKYKKDKYKYKEDKDYEDDNKEDDSKLKNKIKHSKNEKYKYKKDKYTNKFKKHKLDNKFKNED